MSTGSTVEVVGDAPGKRQDLLVFFERSVVLLQVEYEYKQGYKR